MPYCTYFQIYSLYYILFYLLFLDREILYFVNSDNAMQLADDNCPEA